MTHSDDHAYLPDRDDVPLDAELRAAAEHYHVPPPAVPADAMWAAIQARRAHTGATSTRETPPGAPPLHISHLPRDRGGRQRPVWRWAPAAAAAVVLVGVGIGIGRHTAPGSATPPDGVPATRVAARSVPAWDAPVASTPPNATRAADTPVPTAQMPDTPMPGELRVATAEPGSRMGGGPGSVPAVTPAPRDRRGRPSSVRHPVSRQAALAQAGAPGGTLAGGAPASGALIVDALVGSASRDGTGASAPLRVVTEQHLARAEALLTAFTGEEPGGRDGREGAAPAGAAPAGAAPDAAWARDLLTTTRLLLDTPAAREPARRVLLEHLELVLGQIARLPRADTAEERALIDRAIRRGDLMAKLRTAVPAGAPAASRGT